MNGTWIHLNLKTNEILRSNPENKYMFKFNSRNTKTRCDLFKINNKDSRAMISFCLGVD